VRAAPTDDLAAGAMGTALGLHTLMAGRSKRVPAPTAVAFSSAAIACDRCPSLIPEIAASQAAKSSALIESLPRPDQS
jgi:hypothetical protein